MASEKMGSLLDKSAGTKTHIYCVYIYISHRLMCYSQSYCHKPYQVYRLLPEEIINHTFWWSPVLLRLLLCNGTSCSSKKTTGQHWFWQSKCAISPQGCYWVMIYKWWAFHICLFTSGYLSVSHLDIGSFSSFPRVFLHPDHANSRNSGESWTS